MNTLGPSDVTVVRPAGVVKPMSDINYGIFDDNDGHDSGGGDWMSGTDDFD